MKDQKSSTENRGAAIAIVMVAVVLPVLAMGYYAYTSLSGPSYADNATSSQNENGIVAVLGANNQFSDSQTAPTTQQAPVEQTPPSTPDYSLLPYSIALPDGWTTNEAQLCPENSNAKSTTYTNQSKTFVVYENTRPGDCGGAQAADSYLDYDFSGGDTSIIVKTDAIAQCTKQENPACPKGDGKVTVFIGNESPTDPTTDVKNKLTNKTYFVSLTDTNISGDFATQVTELTTLATLLKIR